MSATSELFVARTASEAARYRDRGPGSFGAVVAGITTRDLDRLLRVLTASADAATEPVVPGVARVLPRLAALAVRLAPDRLPVVAKEWAATGTAGGSPDDAADLLGELVTVAFRAQRLGGDLYVGTLP